MLGFTAHLVHPTPIDVKKLITPENLHKTDHSRHLENLRPLVLESYFKSDFSEMQNSIKKNALNSNALCFLEVGQFHFQ